MFHTKSVPTLYQCAAQIFPVGNTFQEEINFSQAHGGGEPAKVGLLTCNHGSSSGHSVNPHERVKSAPAMILSECSRAKRNNIVD